jgi:hypothetical protein
VAHMPLGQSLVMGMVAWVHHAVLYLLSPLHHLQGVAAV